MNKFKETPASERSFSKRTPVFGIGINDAKYHTSTTIKGKRQTCPFYKKWKDMLKMCYCETHLGLFPTYNGCRVASEWVLFSSFRQWMIKQDWEGKQLDKDILISGNKIFGPNSCIFVTLKINSLLTYSAKSRGALPVGVSQKRPKIKRYRAACRFNGKTVVIGTFDTPEDAHAVYLKFKSNHVHEIALQQTDPRLKSALIRISGEIARGEYYK